MSALGAFLGFLMGLMVGLFLWFPLFFAPVAMWGDINSEMPGWAMAASLWFYTFCALVGAVIGGRSDL